MSGTRARRKYTVAQAKNIMRRAVAEIVDPSPASVDGVWEHFENSCAYCGRPLDRALREGQIDHAEADGGNHLGNLVLACGTCNGDEKRDASWRDFLRTKASGDALATREARIEAWFSANPRTLRSETPGVHLVRDEIEGIIAAYETKCAELRQAVGGRL